jgi:hypothetical protein
MNGQITGSIEQLAPNSLFQKPTGGDDRTILSKAFEKSSTSKGGPECTPILLSTDGSDVAKRGVEHGIALAKALNAKVIVITVTEPMKILRAADAFYERRREGPYRFIQNRSPTSVVALKKDAAAEKSEDQSSRDFRFVRLSTFATWGNSGIEPDKGKGISSPGTYEASLLWPCNDGERQWNTMSD